MSHKSNKGISRREFLRVSAAASVGAALAANGVTLVGAQSMYNEAPQLAELVAAGQLPPVAERLPAEPVVIEPLERVGEYGGILRTVMVANSAFQVRSAAGPEGLLRVGRDLQTVEPNLAKSWEWSDDGLTLTIHLHEGIKWSDGVAWDANSVEYWWQNDMLNTEITPSVPGEFKRNGEVAVFNKIDDYTFSWSFVAPHPTMLVILGQAWGVNMIQRTAAHYLQQFHKDFVPEDELNQKVADAGFDSWFQLYVNRRDDAANGMPRRMVEMPTLGPYKLLQPLENNLWVLDRNPYYWKVDTAGNQLPYIDQLIVTNAENGEVANAMIAAGEVNFSNGFVTSLEFFALYQTNAERGNYTVRPFLTVEGSALLLQPNHTVNDPVLRELYNDVRFKQALSYAIDRRTVNNVIYQGIGEPIQTHVIRASRFFTEEYAKAHTDFDLERANALLDEIGLTERDADGFRLRPDGARLTITMEHGSIKTSYNALAQLLVDMWGALGIELIVRAISRDVLEPRILANEIEFGMWHGDKSSDIVFPPRPEWWVPFAAGWEKPWGTQWGNWYSSGGTSGEEPPQVIKDLYDTWQTMLGTVDDDEFIRLGKEILRSQAENLWTIGTIGGVPEPMIVGNNLINFPTEGYVGFDFLGTAPYHSEQLFFEGGRWTGERS